VLRTSTRAVDVAVLLARAMTPEPMRPGWPDALRMSRSVLPHRRLAGIDRRLADGAMVQFTRDEQLASATGVAERLCGRKSFPTYRALLDTVGSKLLRRGFSMTVARAACEAVWRGAGD